MNVLAEVSLETTTDVWADRSQYWLSEYVQSLPSRKKREREPAPLILTGHGLSIRVDKGCLAIRDGNTHYPAKVREWRFFKGGLDMPPRIVLVDGSGNLTLDALDWMSEQSIPFIRLQWDGRLLTAISGAGYSADPDKSAWQIAARLDETERVRFALPLIRQKIEASLVNLTQYLPPSKRLDTAIATAETVLQEIKNNPPESACDLLGLEGKSAAAYFAVWNTLAIKWTRLKNAAVPEDWFGYSSRSALTARKTPRNYRATHPINAMLNYAYGILEAQTRIAVISEGFDPTKGIVHGNKYCDRDTFVFDRMEPMRPLADRRVLELVRDRQFTAEDFTISRHGKCRLNPELARLVVGGSSSAVSASNV